MASYFTLGSLAFDQSSTPESVSFGSKHTVVQHTLLGGKRVFDVMGADPQDPVFSGKFVGQAAVAKQTALAAMSGTVQTLVWGDTSHEVLVVSADFRQSFNVVEYTVTCKIIDVFAKPTAPTAVQSVRTDVGAASDAASPVSALANIKEKLATVTETLSSAKAEVVEGLTTLRNVQSTVAATVKGAQDVIANIGSLGSLGGSTSAAIASLNSLNAALATTNAASSVAGYVGRAIHTIEGA